MDKATFDAVKDIYVAGYDVQKVLESKGLGIDEIGDILEPFDDCCERILKVGKYLDKEKYIGKRTYIKEDYEDVEKNIILDVIYEYDNGMNLCMTTSELHCLIPKELLADY